jgi:hypothetical protein
MVITGRTREAHERNAVPQTDPHSAPKLAEAQIAHRRAVERYDEPPISMTNAGG